MHIRNWDLKMPCKCATFSGTGECVDENYRYAKWYPVSGGGRRLLVIMLKPAGNPLEDDGPTTRAVKTFAVNHDYGEILVGNIFPYMTPHPEDLRRVGYAIAAGGLQNTETQNALHIDLMARQSYHDVLVAWGVLESGMIPYADALYNRLRNMGRNIVCLGKNRNGEPKHPGRLSRSTRFEPYERRKPGSDDAISVRAAATPALVDRAAAPKFQQISAMTWTLPRNTTIREATKPNLLCVACEREIPVGEEYLSERFKTIVRGVKQHRRRMHRAHIPTDHPILAIIAEHGWDETKRLLNEQNA